MNDKQLKILLQQYKRQLNDAIDFAEEEIPEELKEKYKNILGWNIERAPILKKLYELQSDLYEDIKDLEGE